VCAVATDCVDTNVWAIRSRGDEHGRERLECAAGWGGRCDIFPSPGGWWGRRGWEQWTWQVGSLAVCGHASVIRDKIPPLWLT